MVLAFGFCTAEWMRAQYRELTIFKPGVQFDLLTVCQF